MKRKINKKCIKTSSRIRVGFVICIKLKDKYRLLRTHTLIHIPKFICWSKIEKKNGRFSLLHIPVVFSASFVSQSEVHLQQPIITFVWNFSIKIFEQTILFLFRFILFYILHLDSFVFMKISLRSSYSNIQYKKTSTVCTYYISARNVQWLDTR